MKLSLSEILAFFFYSLILLIYMNYAHAAPVIVYQDHPIINDQTITVDTYYDDVYFDGYHTVIYSQRQPQNLFLHQINLNAIDIVHQWAKCWITHRINEIMLERCCSFQRSSTNSTQSSLSSQQELYSISENECEEEEK